VARALLVAVEVLADERGAIPGVVQPGGDGRRFVAAVAEGAVSSVWRPVLQNAGVVRVLCPQKRGARRAAHRLRVKRGEDETPVGQERTQPRQVVDHAGGHVVDHDEDNVRLRGGRVRRPRHPQRQRLGQQHQENGRDGPYSHPKTLSHVPQNVVADDTL
jgi:hypothetical protein